MLCGRLPVGCAKVGSNPMPSCFKNSDVLNRTFILSTIRRRNPSLWEYSSTEEQMAVNHSMGVRFSLFPPVKKIPFGTLSIVGINKNDDVP